MKCLEVHGWCGTNSFRIQITNRWTQQSSLFTVRFKAFNRFQHRFHIQTDTFFLKKSTTCYHTNVFINKVHASILLGKNVFFLVVFLVFFQFWKSLCLKGDRCQERKKSLIFPAQIEARVKNKQAIKTYHCTWLTNCNRRLRLRLGPLSDWMGICKM